MQSKLFSLKNTAVMIIVINVIMFILQQLINGFTNNLMLVSNDILLRPWTLITSMFLHGSPAHLIFNMYALLLFGTLIEQKIGTKRFLASYFGAGILAGLGFVIFQEFIMHTSGAALGASGGVMGILGLTIVLLPKLKVLFFFVIPMSMRTAGIMFAIIDLLGVFGIGIQGIANIAHLVGLAYGVGYGIMLLQQKERFRKRFVQKSPKSTTHHHIHHTERNDSIELSTEDIDDYVKNGRL